MMVMPMNRYAVAVNKHDLDATLKGLRSLGCVVASVSCTDKRYMIIYRSDIEYNIEEIKLKGNG